MVALARLGAGGPASRDVLRNEGGPNYLLRLNDARKKYAPKRNYFVVKTSLSCCGKRISQEVTMKDLVQCRKLEAKFRQLAVSDPARRFLWLAEAEKWEREAEAEIASHFEARNAVRTTGAIEPITTKSSARS